MRLLPEGSRAGELYTKAKSCDWQATIFNFWPAATAALRRAQTFRHESARRQVKSHEQYDPERLTAFVADITHDNPFGAAIEPGTVDLVTMVFVLSAITPERMQTV
jgi:hypothetical protein